MGYLGLNVLLYIILNSSQNDKVKLDCTHHSYLLTIDVLIEHPHFPVLAWWRACVVVVRNMISTTSDYTNKK
jgi:hypothetical protein